MKPLEFSILLVLAEGPEYGYGIVKRIAEAGAGGIRLAPSNLYYVLDRMLGAGLVAEAAAPAERAGGAGRQYYGITAEGRRALAAEAARLARLVERAERLAVLPRGEA